MTDEEIMFARLFAPIKAKIQDKNRYITELEKELELAISDNAKLLIASKGWFCIDKGYEEALAKAKTEYQEELKNRVKEN